MSSAVDLSAPYPTWDAPFKKHLPIAALAAVALMCLPSRACASGLAGGSPHPAVARIMVPERSATSYGTGTLVDVRDQYGLVITNWHVVRDASGPPEVVFPNGFRSQARPLKLDSNWDLAALVIWRPPIEPVTISREPPQPGERLTICGFGQGDYRAVSGRCTQYFAPRVDYPQEFVELDVEARQGDSGGPIFNSRGELAGVLFGAGRGTTMGSYGGRVHAFLASLAPDIGRTEPERIVRLLPPQPVPHEMAESTEPPNQLAINIPGEPTAPIRPTESSTYIGHASQRAPQSPAAAAEPWTASGRLASGRATEPAGTIPTAPLAAVASSSPPAEPLVWSDVAGRSWTSQFGTLLAIIGAIALVMQLAKLAGSR